MPAAIVHDIHGQKVLAQLKNAGKMDSTAFKWGCQGPDFLFCHRALPWMRGENIRHLAGELHKRPASETLGTVVDYVSRHPSVLSASYLLGFFCHYSLDSVAHPYIDVLVKELQEEDPKRRAGELHNEIESALDAIVLRAETDKLPSEIRLQAYFLQDERCMHMIADLYHHLCPETPEGLFYESCQDAGKVFRALNDRTGIKRFFLRAVMPSAAAHIRPLMEDADVDYSNLTKTPWTDRKGEERTDSFFDLLETATKKAVGIIDGFERQNMERLTKDEPF